MKNVFTELGQRLEGFAGRGDVIAEACRANPWFMPEDVVYAVEAIRTRMLDAKALDAFLQNYHLPVATVKNVGVIMAGNIPLAGFYDMMCVLLSGHMCHIKPSSKDKTLMDYIVALLKDIRPNIPLHYLDRQSVDAVLASGSSNTARILRSRYHDIPGIIRGNRSSAAVVEGGETDEQIEALAGDIFRYSGLGCRSVSMIFVPEGYDIAGLGRKLAGYKGAINPKYRNNYLQRRAVLTMEGVGMFDGGFFVLTEGDTFPSSVSQIVCRRYKDQAHLSLLLDRLSGNLQCVVGGNGVPFGEAQRPGPEDFPDGADVIAFLELI